MLNLNSDNIPYPQCEKFTNPFSFKVVRTVQINEEEVNCYIFLSDYQLQFKSAMEDCAPSINFFVNLIGVVESNIMFHPTVLKDNDFSSEDSLVASCLLIYYFKMYLILLPFPQSYLQEYAGNFLNYKSQ
jgi:hypothetical protein